MKIENKLERAVSVDEILKKKFDSMNFEGNFHDLIGTPEKAGSWIIWGLSGNGKTRLTLQICKYITKFGKVAYNTLEEGMKLSFQLAIEQTNMKAVSGRFIILSESIEELSYRLTKSRAPKIVIIDSLQYSNLTKKKYTELINKHPRVLFIFISHAEGKNPKGTTADAVRYHSDVKIRVEGYKAFATSRFGGGEPYTIWDEGAQNYWGLEEF
jgi:hypothetical protein